MLTAPKVMTEGLGLSNSKANISHEFPSLFQVLNLSGHLEIVHIHGQHKSELLMAEGALPASNGLESRLGEFLLAVSLPEDARQRVTVKGQSELNHRSAKTAFDPISTPSFSGQLNPCIDRSDPAIAV